MAQVLDGDVVDGFDHLHDRAVIAFGKLVGKERGGDNEQSLTLKGRLIADALYQWAAHRAKPAHPTGADIASPQACDQLERSFREYERPVNQIRWISPIQGGDDQGTFRGHGEL